MIPEAVASNPEVLRRFEREAPAASARNHPSVDPQGGSVACNSFRVLSSLFAVDGLE